MNDLPLTELTYPSEVGDYRGQRLARPHLRPPNMVVTRTPLRISFAGGGTDLPEFYRVDDGAVLSSAIRQVRLRDGQTS